MSYTGVDKVRYMRHDWELEYYRGKLWSAKMLASETTDRMGNTHKISETTYKLTWVGDVLFAYEKQYGESVRWERYFWNYNEQEQLVGVTHSRWKRGTVARVFVDPKERKWTGVGSLGDFDVYVDQGIIDLERLAPPMVDIEPDSTVSMTDYDGDGEMIYVNDYEPLEVITTNIPQAIIRKGSIPSMEINTWDNLEDDYELGSAL